VTFGIGIADVGAGYTTVLAGKNSSSILDFGSTGYKAALSGLDRMLCHHYHPYFYWPPWGCPALPATSLVVSHPHRDHFSGLLAYASERGSQGRPALLEGQPVKFFHPRIPVNPEALALIQCLMAIDTVLSGIPEYQLGRAEAACADGRVRRIPLQIGSPLELAEQSFDVLWPPHKLSPGLSLRLKHLVEAYDALAARAAENDDRRLLDALSRVREEEALRRDADAGSLYNVPEPSEGERFPDFSTEGDQAGEEIRDDQIGKEMKVLRAAITSGANCLSLVIATTDRQFVFLGDLDKSLHGEVAMMLADDRCGVVVSAHHGTHFGSGLEVVQSKYVFSSVGGSLSGQVDEGYSRMGMHLRTDIAGDISARSSRGSIDISTCSCHRTL